MTAYEVRNSDWSTDVCVADLYHGTLSDGTVFESSYDRGQPAEFPVGGVIPGWTEALQLMNAGSKWRLYVPSELAYDAQDVGSIPPHSVLVFDVELLDEIGRASCRERVCQSV